MFHDQRSFEPYTAPNDDMDRESHLSTSPNQVLRRAKPGEEKNFERDMQEIHSQMQEFFDSMQRIANMSYIVAVEASRAALEAVKAAPEATRERTLLYQTANSFCRGLVDTLRGTSEIEAIVEEISTAISNSFDGIVGRRLSYLPDVLTALVYYDARKSVTQSLPLLAQHLPSVVHDGHTHAADALEEISSQYSLRPLTLSILDKACDGILVHAIPSIEFARSTLQHFARECGLDAQLQRRIDEVMMSLVDVRNYDGRLKYFDSEIEMA
ncbi:uncharacterized protein EV420DRAFT_1090258 [Desarmillaria tabescens]|uniref:Uncharacterized protein n=1 Tax=Armillaria tabescens TaxID=1929756 RepID=A0AA39NDE8_ARMTA|nr:uncharacterized protein EV420DRAFT_1090258 [Desarmillaria tabescens]KAK0463474.1 hypothetical protein EV420DRAFT_1090258 [Desarmillaria tabescens]